MTLLLFIKLKQISDKRFISFGINYEIIRSVSQWGKI
jgi:hypothetical protein